MHGHLDFDIELFSDVGVERFGPKHGYLVPFILVLTILFQETVHWFADIPQVVEQFVLFTGIGGLIEGLLMWANHRFFWWPLHPLGFVVAAGFITGQIWFSAFIAWLLKAIILQYGGPGLFTRLRPLFLGMILGEATTGGLWLVIDALTGNYGNRITAM